MGNTGQIHVAVQTTVVTLPRTSSLIWYRCGGSFKTNVQHHAKAKSCGLACLANNLQPTKQISFWLLLVFSMSMVLQAVRQNVTCEAQMDAEIQSCPHLHLPQMIEFILQIRRLLTHKILVKPSKCQKKSLLLFNNCMEVISSPLTNRTVRRQVSDYVKNSIQI